MYSNNNCKCINNKHVRLVIEYGCPSDLESYYQEIGRAGRDGQESECWLFFHLVDFVLSHHFSEEIENKKYKIYKKTQIEKNEKICKYK